MSRENKKLFQYLGIIFVAVLISSKLPHDSYSIIQYIIKPIKSNNLVINLSGFVPLAMILVGIKGIWKLEKFKIKHWAFITIIVFIFVIPLMQWTTDFTRTAYHWVKNDGVKSINIEKSYISLDSIDNHQIINIDLELKDYSRRHNEFKIRVFLPKSLAEIIGKEYYEFEDSYETRGDRSNLTVHKQIAIDDKVTASFGNIEDENWYYEDVEYEFYNENGTVYNLEHGY
ncbi:MAG: hypothetical protein ACERKZ_10455 [Lachnotalea sp.]